MAKKKEELDFTLDTENNEQAQTFVPVTPKEEVQETRPKIEHRHEGVISCLRNEKVIVRHINRQQGNITNPKHVLYGGMSNNAVRVFSVPKLTSGIYVNVLTNAEKAFLEDYMGLEYNALSIHRRIENFWDDSNANGTSQVRLTKQDNILDLSNPTDYIKYKILLANKDAIAPSMQVLQDSPKATYQFVIINEGDETKTARQAMSDIQRSYKEFGKIEEDRDMLRYIVETLSGKATAANTKLDWLQTKVNEFIQADKGKTFLTVLSDEYLRTKVLIKKAVETGDIAFRGNQFFLREGNIPLCEYGEEPTLSVAAKYLNNPKHQDVLFALQAKLK